MNVRAEDAVDIRLVNDLREIARVAARIDEFCAERELAPEVAYAVNLAIEELLSNTIGHGYADDGTHRIAVVVRLEEGTLVAAIVDDGAAFDPTQAPETDLGALAGEPEMGGLGLLLVNRMMDGVEYRRRAGCNVVTMTKNAAAATEA